MIINLNILKVWIKTFLGMDVHINMYNIHYSVRIYGKNNVKISKEATVAENVIIRASGSGILKINGRAQIGPNTTILVGDNGITINDAAMIGPNCVIVEGKHNFKQVKDFMITSGSFSAGGIDIGEDVWVGANCTIGDNVSIGKGAILAANSFANKNILEYEIHGGVPAKKISSRLV